MNFNESIWMHAAAPGPSGPPALTLHRNPVKPCGRFCSLHPAYHPWMLLMFILFMIFVLFVMCILFIIFTSAFWFVFCILFILFIISCQILTRDILTPLHLTQHIQRRRRSMANQSWQRGHGSRSNPPLPHLEAASAFASMRARAQQEPCQWVHSSCSMAPWAKLGSRQVICCGCCTWASSNECTSTTQNAELSQLDAASSLADGMKARMNRQ